MIRNILANSKAEKFLAQKYILIMFQHQHLALAQSQKVASNILRTK